MTDKNKYQTLLRGKIASAVAEARSASTISHSGVKGAVLEILIRKLFKPLLPSDIGVGTGQVIDQHGKTSNQIDIVLYDKSILPPVLYDETMGIFPIESVLYAIEVKTTLNSHELSVSHESAKFLKDFAYMPGLESEEGDLKHHNVEPVRSVIFALNSDLTGSNLNEAERYEKLYKSKKDKPYIRAICTVGREYWYDNGENWVSYHPINEFDEVLGFISGISNTYRQVALSRHNPLLGLYTMPKVVDVIIGPQTVNRVDVLCSSCGETFKSKPDFGKRNITIRGKICSTSPCPNCGGTLASLDGIYEFKDGEFVG